MSTSLPFLPLAPQCGRCKKKENLMRCARCKVMLYCSQEHQKYDYSDHKHACSAVDKKQRLLDHEEEKLRAEPGDGLFMPANPFENSVGLFWGVWGTRDYMRARFGLVDALGDVNTYDAVRKQLVHARDMLRLCRSDNLGIRDLVPSLLLRLNRDQECYDFIKWWCTTGQDSHYDWANMDLGYLDIQNANAFEPIAGLVHGFKDLGMMNALALLKIKLLLDLVALKNSTDVPTLRVIPRGVFDAIRSHLPRSPIITQDNAMLERDDHSTEIRNLEEQVCQLYSHIHKQNPYCWRLLLYPGAFLEKDERPGMYSRGSFEEAQIVLGYSHDAWIETPGARAVIKAQYEGR
ncbi:hypothetical protein PHISCL_05369 [Aspergillus sclerotialis]|uniref:MYND-type domain-containing protein n=1 Tax=Aspergillus sclerotialis TaxID=2070753 RepID=A0A3A2ZLM3_9EURO|nr:hypothetical protein PHISCL_05369 [Aspergillus sclerotialis]